MKHWQLLTSPEVRARAGSIAIWKENGHIGIEAAGKEAKAGKVLINIMITIIINFFYHCSLSFNTFTLFNLSPCEECIVLSMNNEHGWMDPSILSMEELKESK